MSDSRGHALLNTGLIGDYDSPYARSIIVTKFVARLWGLCQVTSVSLCTGRKRGNTFAHRGSWWRIAHSVPRFNVRPKWGAQAKPSQAKPSVPSGPPSRNHNLMADYLYHIRAASALPSLVLREVCLCRYLYLYLCFIVYRYRCDEENHS